MRQCVLPSDTKHPCAKILLSAGIDDFEIIWSKKHNAQSGWWLIIDNDSQFLGCNRNEAIHTLKKLYK